MKYTKFFACIAFVCLSVEQSFAHRIKRENFSPDIETNYISNLGGVRSRPNPLSVLLPQSGMHPPDSSFPYLTKPSSSNHLSLGKSFLEKTLGIGKHQYKITSHHTEDDSGMTHIYVRQLVNGIEVENGDANINIDKFGRVVSFGESFYKGTDPVKHNGGLIMQQSGQRSFQLEEKQPITEIEAVSAFLKYLEINLPSTDSLVVSKMNSLGREPETVVRGVPEALSDVPVTHKYLQTKDGSLVDVWDIELEMEENWFHGHVSLEGQVLGLVDWVSDADSASYKVFPLGVNDPADGGRQIVVNPADKKASPDGWHKIGKKLYSTTIGNNVYAQENLDGAINDDYMKHGRPDGGKDLKFEFELDLDKEPSTYLNASITNLFYWNNIMHDLFYKYGFDEKSGNFQQENHGKGGKGNDAVIANAQDGAGYNNANFATPPDGKHGKMRMYVWNTAEPKRDGDFESGIIIHEYGHGISTRLTGGPANSGCLGWGESGGMGEGWGDFWATILRMNETHTRENNFAMGSYAISNEKGIRKFVYSTDMKVNPSTYGFIKKFDYVGVHAKGEVWAVILYEVYWNLVDKHGFSKNWFEPSTRDARKDTKLPAGNLIALKLTVAGLKMQPCRPSFVDARDAILAADEVHFGGENVCDLWKGFAKRGLGMGAKKGGNEDFTVPQECQ